MTGTPHFGRVALIGIGLIGSSIARVMRRDGLADTIVACARTQKTLDTALALGVADEVTTDPVEAVRDADLVMICTPVSTYGAIAEAIAPALKPGCILTDVGSVKAAAIKALPAIARSTRFARGLTSGPILPAKKA